jgi:hypothetical protein
VDEGGSVNELGIDLVEAAIAHLGDGWSVADALQDVEGAVRVSGLSCGLICALECTRLLEIVCDRTSDARRFGIVCGS